MKETLFPSAKTFGELFDSATPDKDGAPEPIRLTGNWLGGTRLDPYMTRSSALGFSEGKGVKYLPALYVKPTQELVKALNETLVIPDESGIYFKAVDRDDGTLILVQYNSIIADRWIALVETDSMPRFDRVCPNCGQWQNSDCLNECRKRGFA